VVVFFLHKIKELTYVISLLQSIFSFTYSHGQLVVPITQNYGIANTIKWNHKRSLSFDIVALTARRITFRLGS